MLVEIPAPLGPELLATPRAIATMGRICARRAPGRKVVALAGADFYLGARFAHAIVATSKPRLYANIIIRKDVIYPPENRKS
ncbi:hypothetical protein EJ066_16880 [Mesorhizobium sp. M9A.F.Ca.ET.002.03.1.2]|uniref:RbsD/FucU domain-containing protein n=1 Tax=Mesorhizobium sp. M9A.F.Ca.ET.002.03.1.2 TaxID=2493668 RepID=UPI000F75C184|nr:RbsD/FucU domain-containing protein [Mesorhizobium sp. M9A.F.Ca.ET.002.03.1.2]AZN98700.1 hypothetical protein EJ066_16880 [Mesorhizobium sp. M9A.F.Ca.ET.002.03.1.2]